MEISNSYHQRKKNVFLVVFSGDFTYSVTGGLSFILEGNVHFKKFGSRVRQ